MQIPDDGHAHPTGEEYEGEDILARRQGVSVFLHYRDRVIGLPLIIDNREPVIVRKGYIGQAGRPCCHILHELKMAVEGDSDPTRCHNEGD